MLQLLQRSRREYRRLSASEKSLLLDIDYLGSLSSYRLDTVKVKEKVCCYFPQGRLRVAKIQTLTPPPQGERIKLAGKGDSLPFTGMAVNLEMWAEEINTGQFELRMTITAHGAGVDGVWTIAQGFPFYRDSLLGGVRFAVSDDPQFPLLTLVSHEVPARGILSGMSCKGLLEADSIQGANPRLFLGAEAGGKYIAAFGTINAFPPEDPNQEEIIPYVSLYGGLPERSEGRKLGGLFSVENVQYSLRASPSYSTATRAWESSCALMWSVDLVIAPSPSTGKQHPPYRIPIGVGVYNKDGAIRFQSNLTEGMSLVWDALAGAIPGSPLRIPTSEFQLKDLVKLTELELLAGRNERGELSLEWVSLRVETNEEKNRWVLIDRLLALDAIDFDILVRRPAGNPSVNFTLSGLFGVGKEGVLRLATEFDYSANEADYSFSGQLIDGTKLNIKEILSQFLGHSRYQELPEMEVRDFSFSVRPKSKVYEGEILLHGDWSIPGLSALSLQEVFFRLRHEGEGNTTFQAIGSFELGGVRLFVSADYVSDGHGWTFAGGAYEQEKIPIVKWLGDITTMFGLGANIQLPAPVRGLEISGLGARFNTATKDFSFQGTAEFPVDGKKGGASNAKLTIQVDLEHKPDQASHALTFGGSLQLFEREFAVNYDSQGNTSLLVAAYDGAKAGQIEFKDFVGQISQELAAVIPRGVKIDLTRAQLAFGKTGENSKFLFGVELGAGIQLSNLPLVGQIFDRSQTLSVVLQILAANADFEEDEVKRINQLTASGVTKLPESKISVSERKVHLKASVQFSGISQRLDLPLETNVESAPAVASPGIVSTATKEEKSVKWFTIQKAIGPLHFERFGIGLRAGNIEYLLDASLVTAGLTISLEGLAAECALTDLSKGKFQPTFHLDGLGVGFKRGDLEIGGALSRNPTNDPGQYQYDGAVIITYKKLGIQAIGSYRAFEGRPSLFIYALINYPIGGPSFFFVEGLALGFGYNRSLTVPNLDEIPQFPLVALAISPPNLPPNLTQVASDMGRRLTPAIGEYFLAVGVKFSSFKTIDGFVLLTVLFGEHFEIDVLGMATLSSPPRQIGTGQTPLMTARLALLARYLPENGVLMVMAKLMPDAHVFSPDCHITGGFAFYCWFDKEHKGDFVLTLGGYHKSFHPPAHYPQVPRLGLNWQVSPNLSVKGDAYFALTPSAVMAGGHLQANWGYVAKIGWRRKKPGPDSSSGGNLEEALHESNLSANVAFPDSFNLALPDHICDLISADGPPRRVETEEAESGIDSAFDESVVLLDDIIKVLAFA
jgi:hypothetical protein